jgi:hypothetical protein
MVQMCMGRHGHDRMVVGYKTTCVISAFQHFHVVSWNLRRSVLNTTLCVEVVSELLQVCGFLQVLRFPPPTKLTATI